MSLLFYVGHGNMQLVHQNLRESVSLQVIFLAY